jgi:hypothetical protein
MVDSKATPEAKREAVRDYVWAVHTTYLDHVQHLPPGERARLPLVAADNVTVIAAAARGLHLIATSDALPAPFGQEVEIVDEHLGTRWSLRFFDPSVIPALGVSPDDSPESVRATLGVSGAIYHLTVADGGGLTPHHAQHSGVALANLHAKTSRDLEGLRRELPRQAALVDEFAACVRLGLDRAAALVAAELSGGRLVPAPGTTAASSLAALLEDVRSR